MKKLLKQIFILGAALAALTMSAAAAELEELQYYDDHLDVSGKTVEILDAGTPTSYQVGYGVEENTVPDAAVLTLAGDQLIATGIGTAKVRIDGADCDVEVTAAPISLLLLAGQSNMQGSEGDANQSIICPEGQVYSTYGDRYTMTVDNATNFAPSALTGAGSAVNVNGTAVNLEDWPVYLLNEAGAGKAGPDSGFGYEWAKQTGEKVWVVNAAHGGTSINVWQKGTTQYEECAALFSACQETLRKEIAAGHYTLSHMVYFWCQGCSDYSQTAQWYVRKYLAMHENFKTEFAFDADSDPDTPDVTFEFGGIIPVRSGHEYYTSYRQGVYEDTTSAKYHESFKDLRFTGPRVAQYWMANNPELPDIWNVCNIGEDWVWMPDGTNGVSAYFNAHYENGRVDYTPQVEQKASWYTPTTPAAVHDSIHYNQIGYNEVGREAARNMLRILGETELPEEETTVKFLCWDGFSPVQEISAATVGSSATLVVPMVRPVYQSKEVTYALSEGLSYKYYDLLSENVQESGTLSALGAEETPVAVKAREFKSFRWDLEDGILVSTGETESRAKRLAGSTENGIFLDTRYQLAEPFMLLHDQEWLLEWKMTGPWFDESSVTSKKLFCEDGTSAAPGAMCLMVSGKNDRIHIGYYGTNTHISYGVPLAEYGISVSDTHVYRLANHINEDGSNTIYLFVDGKQIGSMTHYFTGSGGDMGVDTNDLSGRDISFGYLGAPSYLLDRGTIEYICVVECDAAGEIHFHDWNAWESITAPGPDGSGEERRICAGCGETESREVVSIWQATNIAEHWNELPENICPNLNLWAVLEHDPTYYVNSKGDWGTHSSGKVHSVTIPVSPGDEIYATSFGAASVNGHGSSNGIRVTFFDINGVVKTTDPANTYAEFTANGGYLIAPEGAIAINVPMWNNSDENELYILNADHDYNGVACTICGERNPERDECPENPITAAWPVLNTDLTHIICYGQSFSNGSDAPGYPDPIVDGTYVLGSIGSSKIGDSLKPLQMTSGTQHPIVSAVNSLSQMLTADGIDTDIIAGSYGTGGRTIAQLMSEERQSEIKAEEGYAYDCLSSGKYQVFQNSVAAIADYAGKNAQTVSCPVIVYLQGETDQNTDEQLGYPDNPIRAGYGAGGDKEKYKEYMSRLKEDMQREVMAAYGQTEKPLFLIYQVSGTYVRTPHSAINMAQIEFAQENEDVILVQTPYFAPHYTVSHHLTVNGYRWLGEYIARSMYAALVERTKPWPMLPIRLDCETDHTIRIRVGGAEGGLSIDTYTVEDATDGRNKYGFAVLMDGTRVVPESVVVSGDEILLTLPKSAKAISAASSVCVQYAGQSAKGTGNIRDNSSETGFYAYLDDSNDTGTGNNQGVSHSALDAEGNSLVGRNYPLYRWLASFCYEVHTNSLHEHSYKKTVVAPNCTGEGYTAYACACGEAYAKDFAAPNGEHSYSAVMTEPTCTEQGYTTYTCVHCGEYYTDHYMDSRGHSYDDDRDVDCNLCGEKRKVAVRLGGSVKSRRDGAKVTLQGVGETTVQDGGYAFDNVEQGSYTLTVKQDGCLTYTMQNIVVDGIHDVTLPEIQLIAGDVNSDDLINARDIAVFRKDFGKRLENVINPLTDIDGNGMVNAMDITALRRGFGKSAEKDCIIRF